MRETRFKQTEIGLIPEDWDILSVGKDCTVKARIGWQGLTTSEYMQYGKYALITSTDIIDGKINWNSCFFVSKLRYEQDRNIMIKKGDILISKDGTIGKVAVVSEVPFPTTLNSGIFVIRAKKQELQYATALAFISTYFKDFIKKLTAGSTIIHLYQKDIIKFTYPLPKSVNEQKKIVLALTAIDELIISLDRLIKKKRLIKQGTMQELLTGKRRLFKDSEGKWIRKNLGEILTIKHGYSFKNDEYLKRGKFLIVTISNVQNNYFDKAVGSYIDILPHNLQRHQRLVIGDIIISLTGNIGRVCKVNCEKCLLNQRVGLLEFKEKSLKDFIYYRLQYIDFINYLNSNSKGVAQQNIGSSEIENFKFFIPPTLKEINAITSIIAKMDENIRAIESKKIKYEQIKQGMMQQLLTGKIRLISS